MHAVQPSQARPQPLHTHRRPRCLVAAGPDGSDAPALLTLSRDLVLPAPAALADLYERAILNGMIGIQKMPPHNSHPPRHTHGGQHTHASHFHLNSSSTPQIRLHGDGGGGRRRGEAQGEERSGQMGRLATAGAAAPMPASLQEVGGLARPENYKVTRCCCCCRCRCRSRRRWDAAPPPHLVLQLAALLARRNTREVTLWACGLLLAPAGGLLA